MALIDHCDVEKLIAAVQCRRPLYDNSAKEQGTRNLLERLWNEVSNEMNTPASKCKAKWQQLRNSFVRSYRGMTGLGKKRRKWYLHDALSFMEPFIKLQKLEENDEDPTSSDDHNTIVIKESENEEKSNESTTENQDETPKYPFSYFPHHATSTIMDLQNVAAAAAAAAAQDNNNSLRIYDNQNHSMPPKLHIVSPSLRKIPSPPRLLNMSTSSSTTTNLATTNSIPSTNITSASSSDENPLLNFCKGILPEFDRLTVERQRKFKTEILICLNRHLDEQERERIITNSNNSYYDENIDEKYGKDLTKKNSRK